MSNNYTFNCWNCRKSSKYSYPAETRNMVMRKITMKFEDEEEARVYYCEHCKKANQITQRESAWTFIG